MPHVARADVDEVLRLVEPAILALENAHIPTHVVLVEDAVIASQELVATEAIAHALDRIVPVGVGAAVAVLEDVGVALGIKDGDVLGRQPLGDVHITPAVRVVFFRVGVDNDVLGVQVRDANLTLERVGKVEACVKESAATDAAIGEELGAHPLQLVVLGDLHPDLVQRLGGLGRRTVAGLEENLSPILNLHAEDRRQGAENLVDGERRPALQSQRRHVGLRPLIAGEELLALMGLLQELKVAAVSHVLISHPLFGGELRINRHGEPPSVDSQSWSQPPCLFQREGRRPIFLATE